MSDQDLKECPKCGEEKHIYFFYTLKTGLPSHWCKSCVRASVKSHWEKNKDFIRAKKRKWYSENKEEIKKKAREWIAKTGYKKKYKPRPYNSKRAKRKLKSLRDRVLIGLGHKCKCCAESNREFLALDHVKNDGAFHRKLKSSVSIYREVIRLNFPGDRFRLLCHNCNQSIGYYGYCPHGNLKNVDSLKK